MNGFCLFQWKNVLPEDAIFSGAEKSFLPAERAGVPFLFPEVLKKTYLFSLLKNSRI